MRLGVRFGRRSALRLELTELAAPSRAAETRMNTGFSRGFETRVTFLLTRVRFLWEAEKSRPRKGRQPVTPTDGAGAVPAGGGSSLPLPGDPGIDPAGIMTGARGASLKRDAKAKVTPAHCIARSAARIEPRHMAEASAAVERRKASALRSARGRAPQSTDDWCAFSALRLPLFFWRQKICGFGRQNPDPDCVAGTRLNFHLSPRAGRGRVSVANEGEGASPRF